MVEAVSTAEETTAVAPPRVEAATLLPCEGISKRYFDAKKPGTYCEIDSGEVREALSNHDLSDAQAIGSEGSDDRFSRVGILNILSSDSWVDERNNTTKSGGSWKSRVRADGWDAGDERVEVLLSGDEATSSLDSSIAGAELSDDQIGLREFPAWVGGSEEEGDGLSGQGCGLSGLSEVGERRDGVDGSVALFLGEAVKRVSIDLERQNM